MLSTPALVTAAQGEDNFPTRVLEGVCWATDPFLELRQGIVSVSGKWLGLSSSEAVVVLVVVDLLDQAEWL